MIQRMIDTAKRMAWLIVMTAALSATSLAAHAAPNCAALATDPANGIYGEPNVKSVTSAMVAATGTYSSRVL